MDINTEDFGYNDKLSFIAEWKAHKPPKTFLLEFYPYDSTILLRDMATRKLFVKRLLVPTVTNRDISIDNVLIVFNRLIHIKDYANTFTKNLFGPTQEDVCFTIKPLIKSDKYGEIIQIIEKHFTVLKLRMSQMDREAGLILYGKDPEAHIVPALIDHIVSGPCVSFQLRAYNARAKMLQLLGPTDPQLGRTTHPQGLRSIYGVDRIINAFRMTREHDSTEYELEYLFRSKIKPKPTTVNKNSALAIMKPHAVKKKRIGEIIGYITENGFTIRMMQIFYFTELEMDDFLEAYQGVVDNFFNFKESFLRGPALVMEIGSNDPDLNVFEAFRDFTGMRNPDINSRLKPFTLRTKFGENKYHNAVYCGDIESAVGDAMKFFFETLQ